MKLVRKLHDNFERYFFITNNWRARFCDCYIFRNELYKTIKNHAKYLSGRVLDVGCGSKPYEELFTGTKEYVGLDYETPDLESEFRKNADFYYDGVRFPFEDETFDHCFSSQCLEHMPNPEIMFRECSRVTKKGGYLFLTVPLTFFEHFQPYDYYRFTQFSLKKHCEDVGYEVVEIRALESTVQTLLGLFVCYISMKFGIKYVKNLIIFALNAISPLVNFLMPKDYKLPSTYTLLARKKY